MKPLVLASASPRRKELLHQIGLQFEVEPSHVPEEMPSDLSPHLLARRISAEKARAVAANRKDALIIAADTFIVVDGKILGKPHTSEEAYRMLSLLNGRTHSVITGFTLLDAASGKMASDSVETKVRMKNADRGELEAYVRSGEPLGKAGAYAIQGLGAVLIEGIEGDYSNVVGLPLRALAEALRQFGIEVLPTEESEPPR